MIARALRAFLEVSGRFARSVMPSVTATFSKAGMGVFVVVMVTIVAAAMLAFGTLAAARMVVLVGLFGLFFEAMMNGLERRRRRAPGASMVRMGSVVWVLAEGTTAVIVMIAHPVHERSAVTVPETEVAREGKRSSVARHRRERSEVLDAASTASSAEESASSAVLKVRRATRKARMLEKWVMALAVSAHATEPTAMTATTATEATKAPAAADTTARIIFRGLGDSMRGLGRDAAFRVRVRLDGVAEGEAETDGPSVGGLLHARDRFVVSAGGKSKVRVSRQLTVLVDALDD